LLTTSSIAESAGEEKASSPSRLVGADASGSIMLVTQAAGTTAVFPFQEGILPKQSREGFPATRWAMPPVDATGQEGVPGFRVVEPPAEADPFAADAAFAGGLDWLRAAFPIL